MTTLAPAEVEVEQPRGGDELEHDRPWVVIVWNDPINLISTGSREKAEHDVARLHGHGLWATMQRD
jgi:ATP-dependent Clp protease adaptor protein ClpS